MCNVHTNVHVQCDMYTLMYMYNVTCTCTCACSSSSSSDSEDGGGVIGDIVGGEGVRSVGEEEEEGGSPADDEFRSPQTRWQQARGEG